MQSTGEKRRRWEFSIPENGLWEWRVVHPDGRTACGACGYRTLKECVDDAKKFGYVYGLRRGATMHKLGAKTRLGRARLGTDALQMYELLKKLAASEPGDTNLINGLREEARTLLAVGTTGDALPAEVSAE